MRRIAIACFILAALPGAAIADELNLREKLELRKACQQDIKTLCGATERGDGHMLQCIGAEKDKLSQPCRDAITKLRGNLLAAPGQPMDY